MSSRWFAVLSLGISGGFCLQSFAATRPRYGGVLRVEVRESFETADPPQTGYGMANLAGPFSIVHWEAGRRAIYSANESATGGRPFIDSVEIVMSRSLREQSIDLELSKTDVVQLAPNELRRQQAGRKTWSSMPVRILALAFNARVDLRIREALALAVDRAAIHNVLLQRQGEVSGALLPQWLSGYAYLFPAAADISRARSLASAAPVSSRSITLGVSDNANRPIAERIALNARDAGLIITVLPRDGDADVKLTEARITSSEPAKALAGITQAFGLGEQAPTASPESLYLTERGLLETFRIIPLFHLPDVYGVSPQVKGGPGISPLGEWRFGDLWIEGVRP